MPAKIHYLNNKQKIRLDEYLRVNERETEEELVSVKEAAKLLNVDRTTLWRWEKNNYLLPTRIGHKVRYRMSEINKTLCNGNIIQYPRF